MMDKIDLKQTLILFLIGANPGIKSIYRLVWQFDKADFPGRVGKEIEELVAKGYIIVTNYFENGTESHYKITDKGSLYLSKNFNEDEILHFINQMRHPEVLFKLTQSYIEKFKADDNV